MMNLEHFWEKTNNVERLWIDIMKRIVLLVGSIMLIGALTGCISQRRNDPHTQMRTIFFDGIERSFRIHIPPNVKEQYNCPLLFVLHGGGGTAEGMEEYLTGKQFNRLSETEGFIVVYPQGYENHWNDGRKNTSWQYQNITIDDVGFLTTLINTCCDEFNIDTKKVYFCGISNGAHMCYRMACERTEKIAGIATVVGSMSEDLIALCSPHTTIPIFITTGTDDPLVPYEGGEITLFNKTYGWVISANETILYWVHHNTCDTKPVIDYLTDLDPTDNVTVRTEEYLNGDNNSKVLVYIMLGGGHTWSGGPQYLNESIIGHTCYDYDACKSIWDFFKSL